MPPPHLVCGHVIVMYSVAMPLSCMRTCVCSGGHLFFGDDPALHWAWRAALAHPVWARCCSQVCVRVCVCACVRALARARAHLLSVHVGLHNCVYTCVCVCVCDGGRVQCIAAQRAATTGGDTGGARDAVCRAHQPLLVGAPRRSAVCFGHSAAAGSCLPLGADCPVAGVAPPALRFVLRVVRGSGFVCRVSCVGFRPWSRPALVRISLSLSLSLVCVLVCVRECTRECGQRASV